MADQEHVEMLLRGAGAWNEWRRKKPGLKPDLVLADIGGSAPDLSGAYLNNTDFAGASLEGVNLSGANLSDSIFASAKLGGADLSGANLDSVDFTEAELAGANLRGANLSGSRLVSTDLRHADLTGCRIFGIAAWNLRLEGAVQANLTITEAHEPRITTDDLQVAQFIHLMLRNENIRNVIDSITSKAVLILGRFTPERKEVLNAIRDELRRRNYLPILFDFEKPASRDLSEAISTLAHIAKFIIADLTDARSIPAELADIVKDLPSVPVQPLIHVSDEEYALFSSLRRKCSWILETYRYESKDALLASIETRVIGPADAEASRIRLLT